MTVRVAGIIVGVLLLIGMAAALVRELVLAAGGTWVWPFADFWRRLLDEPSWSTTGSVALVAALFGALLLAPALWPRAKTGQRPSAIAVDSAAGATSLSITALERAVRHSLKAAGVGFAVKTLDVSHGQDGLRLRVVGDAPAEDLLGMQAVASAALRPELERMTGLNFEAVDMVARRLVRPAK